MDRIDRLNIIDIFEEIEVNGMFLDSFVDWNGVGIFYLLDSYVYGVYGYNNMGICLVIFVIIFGMGYGIWKNELLYKMDRIDCFNIMDILEEIEVNG